MPEDRTDSSKYSSKDLAKTILLVAGTGLLVSAVAVMPGLAYAFKPFLKNKNYPACRVNQALNSLLCQGLIKMEKIGAQTSIQLTEKGRQKILNYQLREKSIKKQKWDQWWRIVIFDIPEKKKTARDFLRCKLKDLDFYMLQKSVLVTPWNCREIVDLVKVVYGVEKDVSLILAKHFDEEDIVKSYFAL